MSIKRISINIEEELYKQVKHIAVDQNINVSDLIRNLLVEFAEKYKFERG